MLKAAVIGAGSTYTPEFIDGIIARSESLPFDKLVLMDTDKERLEIVGGLARRQFKSGGAQLELVLTEDLDEALENASFVFTQMRVGKLQARIRDEKIPLKYGYLGQETTGVGGFMKALRTIPVIMDIAKRMERLSAKGAWMINFANPSGIIAEAVLNHTDMNMIGLCNGPVNMVRRISALLGIDCLDYEYVGLNHLSWITRVTECGKPEDLVPEILGQANTTPWLNYDPRILHAIPYIPSSYLHYYYTPKATVQACVDAEKTRGEICALLEADLLKQFADPALCAKPPELDLRNGAMYSTAALSAVESIAGNKGEKHVVATKNKGAIPFLGDDDIVEILCKLGKDGAVPQKVSVYNEYMIGLMRAVKSYEKLTASAALNGDRNAALAALMVHPLIGDFTSAAAMLDEMLDANREFLPKFS